VSATLAGFGALLVAACCSDVLKLRIPNAIPLGLVLLFGLEVLLGGIAAPLGHLQAMLLALAILVPLFGLNMLGGGDVKLLTAVALWLGMSKLALLLISVGIVGGVFALVWLPLRRLVRCGLSQDRVPESFVAGAPLPFALPITIIAIPLATGG
jgi:prepilin peptidase CpaA